MVRKLIVAGAAVLGLLGVVSPAAAQQATGSISGRVTTDDGLALQFSCIRSIHVPSGAIRSTGPAFNGQYSIGGLPDGSYLIQFCGDNSHAGEWYDDSASSNGAIAVTITNGAAVTGIDALLVRVGRISGRVTNAASGAGLRDVCASTEPASWLGVVRTASDGSYTLTARAGTYRVIARPCPMFPVLSSRFAPAEYPAEVVVASGVTTTGIDVALPEGGVVKGTLVDETTGTPIAGACAAATGQQHVGTRTDADGKFRVEGLAAGDYTIAFEDCASDGIDHAKEWHDDAGSASEATPITVALGQTITVNADLPEASSISGVVSDGVSGVGIANACVEARSGAGGEPAMTRTGADGSYTIANLRRGTYLVSFLGCISDDGSGPDLAPEYFDDATFPIEIDPVVLVAGEDRSGVNAALGAGGHIDGTVTALDTGAPLAGVCVSATSLADGSRRRVATTGADGTYLIDGLATGKYLVGYEPCAAGSDGYAPEYLRTRFGSDRALVVKVIAGQATSGVNVNLAPGARISGTVVRDGSGLALACVAVRAERLDTSGASLFSATARTGGDGHYTLSGLAAGSYTVSFQLSTCAPPTMDAGAPEYFDEVSDPAAATPVVVQRGRTVRHVDASIPVPA